MHQFFVKVLIVQKCPFNVFLMWCNYQKLTTGPSENKLSSVNKLYFHYFSPTRGEHHVEHYVVSSEIKIEK